MKRSNFAIIVCSGLAMAAGMALADNPPPQPAPTRAEIRQKALQDGPSTPQIGYLTQKAPVGPHRDPTPVDPKLLRPLTQREIGMLYNACIAYPECKSAYSKAYEHQQALLKAGKAAGEPVH